MPKPYDVAVVGRGGQGVVFLARVLAEAALIEGLSARVTESHGMAMRGGSVTTFLRLGEAAAPLFPAGSGDLLLALDAREAAGGLASLGPDASVLVNSPPGVSVPGAPPALFTVPADSIARSEGAPRSANLALLGAASALPGFPVGLPALARAVRERGRDRERNLAILNKGAAAVRDSRQGG